MSRSWQDLRENHELADRDPGAAAAPRTDPPDTLRLERPPSPETVEANIAAVRRWAAEHANVGSILFGDAAVAWAAWVAIEALVAGAAESGASSAADDRDSAALPGLDNPKCQRCGGPHQFDTSIASPLWNRVIRDAGEADYLCASCILVLFVRAETSFEAELYGAAVDIYGAEVPTINVQVGSRPLDRSYGDLQAQLRAALPHGEPARTPDIEPEQLARAFHDAYEHLAPRFGYKTRRPSAVPWPDVPETNRQLMIATAARVIEGWEPARTAGDPLAPEPKWSTLVERVAALEAALTAIRYAVRNAVYTRKYKAALIEVEDVLDAVPARAALSEASSVREPEETK